ncbi:hypothetical protein [Flavisolibacter ginsenosidimutans]|uniref:Uncharacterized protein n=1 Tax=Flavisolibacter ginsenosidimutans TaxID=661481 RepID=A0A5B8UFF5_9BACT|nr:hypothetical protein [Flavisolibacter ginsenosidimutans]QEC55387.1 hypothetical protein FSB75_05525 [Flavisolibacter ginsenosidimutans]
MKTTATQKNQSPVLQTIKTAKVSSKTSPLRIVYKSDLNNHRFAQHDNQTVHDAASWDQSWFGNYE